jgi:uroporphyrinogen-III decarboxylase
MLPDKWNEMTPAERMDFRLGVWASTEGKEFVTPEIKAKFETVTKRFVDVLKLQQPDAVPVQLVAAGAVPEHAGITRADMLYDYEKAVAAMMKFHEDFDLDYQAPGEFWPGPVFDRLGYKLYEWPGRHLPPTKGYQAIEAERMTADEYPELINDSEKYMLTKYFPRVFEPLGAFSMLPTFWGATELPFVPFMMTPFAIPPVQEAFEAFFDAAKLSLEFMGAMGAMAARLGIEFGLPGTLGGFSKVPFDFIGDTLRGTKGIMLDMYRRPAEVLAACDALVPMAVDFAVGNANASGNPFIYIVMHKGADGFMSNDDFKKFYWPGFKKLMLGIIEQGAIPFNFVEGSYNSRLDIIAEDGEIPPGTTMWMFDKTDMAEAKKKFGPWAAIGGNIPASLFKAGTPEQMRDKVRETMEVAAPGGGYFMTNGAIVDNATDANMEAYLAAGREFGKY